MLSFDKYLIVSKIVYRAPFFREFPYDTVYILLST